ncbi:hypothetical protein GCM10027568_08470 [Humibacter soli]
MTDDTDRQATERFLLDDLEADRRWEFRLIYKAAIALAIVVAIVVVRQVFFS